MLGNQYTSQTCSIAGALEVVGERWSLLIVRDILLGLRRFDELQSDLGIARNVLQTRLTRLLEQGVLEKRLYQEHPPRYEYRLTDKGLDLWPTVVALMQWGDRGTEPGKMNTPHTIASDAQGNIYVGDRGNARQQRKKAPCRIRADRDDRQKGEGHIE